MNQVFIKNPCILGVELTEIYRDVSELEVFIKKNFCKDSTNPKYIDYRNNLDIIDWIKLEFFYKTIDEVNTKVVNKIRKIIYINSVVGEAYFVNGELVSCDLFPLKKAEGLPGERITKFLADMPDKDILIALDEFFGKTKKVTNLKDRSEDRKIKESVSQYLLGKPLYFNFVRLGDGVKAIAYDNHVGSTIVDDIEKHLTAVTPQRNKCELGSDIPEHLLERSLDSSIVPYHSCKIPFKTMQLALHMLDPESFAWIATWYFPHEELTKDLDRLRKTFKYLKNHSDKRDYNKAWRAKNEALDKLAQTIMIIQTREIAQSN